MADNVTSNPGAGGAIFSADEESANLYVPYSKLKYGADGTFTIVSTTNGLPTQLRNSSGTEIGTSGAPVRVDPTGTTTQPVSGTVTANAGTNLNTSALALETTQTSNKTALELIDDIVHSGNAVLSKYAAIGAVFDDVSVATVTENQAQTLRMSSRRELYVQVRDAAGNERGLNVDGSGSIGVTDAGGSITVDGTVGVSGAVDTELPAAAALADAAANATTPTVGAANLLYNGSTWDRVRGDTTNGVDVDVTRLPALVAGTANIGDVDIVSGPTGSSALQVQGTAAHDAAAANNPILIAGRANANEPTEVTDADAVYLWADKFGRLVTVGGHPNTLQISVNATSSGNTSVISTPGASVSLYICKGSIHNAGSANNLVKLTDGSGGTTVWRAELKSEGGGSLFDFGNKGWKLTADTALFVNLGGAGDIDINVTEYYISA